ncbi:MAG: hypothetical protein HPY57_13355 [Ignavibacteria bacterium]|nr:hypothetical protein [Ignavibacteria bacterium]
MNFIGIDISKVSTSMVIETDEKEYIFSYNTNKPTYKWNKCIENIVKIKTYEYDNSKDNYSDSEIDKLKNFSKISNDLIEDIINTIVSTKPTIIYIEGYSYGKDSSQIIDLVGIGSIVRSKIFENIPNIKKIKIIAPKSLKLIACEMIYGYEMINIGKKKEKIVKIINTSEDGKKGGDFDKKDMFKMILKSHNKCILDKFYNENVEEILSLKTFPKPLEDINDAWLLKEIIKYEYRHELKEQHINIGF